MSHVPRCLLIFVLLAGCSGPEEPRLLAAASLERVLPGILDASGSATVAQSYAASSILARQIELGAEADLFVSADRAWVDYLRGRGHAGALRAIASNELVVWGRAGQAALRSPEGLREARWRRIAVGDESTPVGRYARAALLGYELERRLLPCRDARAVMRTLAIGEADAALAYRTDGRGMEGVTVLWRFGRNPEVGYWALQLSNRPAASQLMDALLSPNARNAFESHGFGPPLTEETR